jgi:hypothetical protein
MPAPRPIDTTGSAGGEVAGAAGALAGPEAAGAAAEAAGVIGTLEAAATGAAVGRSAEVGGAPSDDAADVGATAGAPQAPKAPRNASTKPKDAAPPRRTRGSSMLMVARAQPTAPSGPRGCSSHSRAPRRLRSLRAGGRHGCASADPRVADRANERLVMRTRRWLTPSLFVVTLALVGCDAIDKLKQAADQAAGKPAATETRDENEPLSDDPDMALGLKLNQPIECVNFSSGAVFRSYDRYRSWWDPKTGPTGQEKVVYGLYGISSGHVDRCKKALAELEKIKQPPTPELDGFAKTYGEKLDAVVKAVEEAEAYYKDGGHKADSMAKGKAMHPTLMKAFEEFEAADEDLRGEIRKLQAGASERELAKVEKAEGKKLYWHKLHVGIVAERVVIAGNKKLDEIDTAALEKAIGDLEEAAKGLREYVKANGAEASNVFMWNSFEEKPAAVISAAKAVLDRAKTKKPFEQSQIMMIEGGNPQMIPGHPANLLDKYNEMVKASNQMKFRG